MGEDKKQDTSQKDRNEALNCLRDICANGGKDSDRISAAKLLLEYGEGESDDALTVIMEGAAGEYGNKKGGWPPFFILNYP